MAPPIPNEIYRCIIDQFHRNNDQRTLLSMARCSSLLRYESQRMLFHTAFQDSWNTVEDNHRQRRAILKRHQAFLEAIVNSPARLGPFVKSYSQWRVAYDGRDDPKYTAVLRCRVFELTANALRYMVNLKELKFSPFPLRVSVGNILQGCTFQLECLVWTPWVGNEQEWTFLDSQKSLLHFDASHWVPRSFRPTCLSPKLKSIRGSAEDLFMLNKNRTIVALDYWENQSSKYLQHISDTGNILDTVRYLRVPSYNAYLHLINGRPPWLALGMMELTVSKFKEVLICTMLPSTLLVLVLRVEDKDSRVQDRTDAEKFIWISSALFLRFPALKYINIYGQSRRNCISSWRYLRPVTDSDTMSVEISDMDDLKVDGWWRNHITDC